MDRVQFTKAKGRQPGRSEYKQWLGRVLIGCPNCGESYQLDHEINSTGEVDPSVECPTVGCGFKNYVKLEGFGG